MLFDISKNSFEKNKLEAVANCIDNPKLVQIRSHASDLTTRLFNKLQPGYIAASEQSMNFHKQWMMRSINGQKVY